MALSTFNTLKPIEAVKKQVIATELTVAAVMVLKRVRNENTNDKNVTRVVVLDEVLEFISTTISHRLFLRLFPSLHQTLA